MMKLYVGYKEWFINEADKGRIVPAIEETLFVGLLIDLVMVLMILGFFTDVNMYNAINNSLILIGVWKLVWFVIKLKFRSNR